jgi:transposase
MEDVQKRLKKERKGEATPTVKNLRRALAGHSYKRGVVERRGRKSVISQLKLRKLNSARLLLQKRAAGLKEVTLKHIKKEARVTASDAAVSRALKTLGVSWRSPREKPTRTPAQEKARQTWCAARRHLTPTYWKKRIHMYMDCKRFALPVSATPRALLARGRVRGAFRTKSESLKSHLTKPNAKRHRVSPGASAWVLAGVINDRITMWRYIRGRWNAAKACQLYKTGVLATLQRVFPSRRSWTVVEDNDPAGFKAKASVDLKTSLKIQALSLPPYSPDLMPLDYSIWTEIENRALKSVGDKKVTAAQYRATLRRVATSLPRAFMAAAVGSMSRRVAAIVEAKGGNIRGD